MVPSGVMRVNVVVPVLILSGFVPYTYIRLLPALDTQISVQSFGPSETLLTMKPRRLHHTTEYYQVYT